MHVSGPRRFSLNIGEHLRRYNDAMATIRRVPSIEHNFQLVITRVYEEGDQELLEDEEESEYHPSLHASLAHASQPMRKGSSS